MDDQAVLADRSVSKPVADMHRAIAALYREQLIEAMHQG